MRKILKHLNITTAAYALLVLAILLALWFLYLGGYFTGDIKQPDPDRAKEIQPFISGLVLPLLTLGSTLLVIANLRSNTLQNFSSNFFKLIDQHHKLVDNINSEVYGISTPEKVSKGREFFDDLSSRIAIDFEALVTGSATQQKPETREINQPSLGSLLSSLLLQVLAPIANVNVKSKEISFELDSRLVDRSHDKSGKELLKIIWDHYYHIHQSDLGHYFRNLYHIVQFVERAPIRMSSKIVFVKMLRAQLSNYELLLLSYNGMSDYGAKFYPLIEKYELLKNLNNEQRVPEGYEKRIVEIGILTETYPHLKKHWGASPTRQ